MLILFIILVIIITCISIFFIECRREATICDTKEIYIDTKKINKAYKFLYISDFHNSHNPAIFDMIKANIDMHEDIKDVVSGGDMITHGKKRGRIGCKNFFVLLDILKRKNINFIYGYGNHEERVLHRNENTKFKVRNKDLNFYNQEIKKYDVKYFDYDKIALTDDINIYEINLNHDFYKKNISYDKIKNRMDDDIIKDLMKIDDIDKTKYNIIISHNPDYSEKLIDFGFDLVLSGHHHGGLIRLPKIGAIISPELTIHPPYTKGQYKYLSKDIVASNGLYDHSIGLRFLNIPEMYVININNET